MHGERLNNLEILPQHLSDLSVPQRKDIIQIIRKCPSLLSDAPSQTNVVQNDIVLVKDTTTIWQHLYRVNPIKRGLMEKEVKYLCDNSLAKPSVSP